MVEKSKITTSALIKAVENAFVMTEKESRKKAFDKIKKQKSNY